jgi:hypothetical protein
MARIASNALVAYKQNIAILSCMLSAPFVGFLLFSWDGLESVALACVLIGVVGEVWSEKQAPPSTGYAFARRKKYDLWSSVMLMLGLTFELAAFPHHISESAKLKNQTEQLRNDNLRLKKEMAPRRLTGKEKDLLSASVNVTNLNFLHAGWRQDWKLGIMVASVVMDPESSDFASDFISALQKAGWNAWPNPFILNPRFGVHLRIMRSTPPDLPGLKELRQALHLIGVQYDEIPITEEEADQFGLRKVQSSMIYLFIQRMPLHKD